MATILKSILNVLKIIFHSLTCIFRSYEKNSKIASKLNATCSNTEAKVSLAIMVIISVLVAVFTINLLNNAFNSHENKKAIKQVEVIKKSANDNLDKNSKDMKVIATDNGYINKSVDTIYKTVTHTVTVVEDVKKRNRQLITHLDSCLIGEGFKKDSK